MTYNLIILLCLALLSGINQINASAYLSTNDELGKTTAELVRLRGYNAEDHYVITVGGYILDVVRAWNPLISDANKDPILFVHGLFVNGNCFLTNSVGASPKDYSNLNAGSMSIEELERLLQDDPTSNSLVFTALNFGHECWIMNRRGTYQSQAHVGKDTQPYVNPITNIVEATFGGLPFFPSARQVNTQVNDPLAGLITFLTTPQLDLSHLELFVNPRYWNFSLDEQSADLAQVMDYCLEQSGRSQLAIVGHSAGGALPLMTLINNPERASKVSHALLWAPALYPTGYRAVELAAALEPLSRSLIVPFPPSIIRPLIQNLLALICQTTVIQDTLCKGVFDLFLGLGGSQEKITPGMMVYLFDSFSSHSIGQILQAADKGKMHHYDHGNSRKNTIAYGQPEAPLYDVSRIKPSKMSLWFGGTDALVSIESGHRIVGDLTFPVEAHYLDQPGLFFNHISYFQHKNVSKLVIIPGLKFIESA